MTHRISILSEMVVNNRTTYLIQQSDVGRQFDYHDGWGPVQQFDVGKKLVCRDMLTLQMENEEQKRRRENSSGV